MGLFRNLHTASNTFLYVTIGRDSKMMLSTAAEVKNSMDNLLKTRIIY